MSEDCYTHRWTWEQRLLHPAIQHINCSPDINHETLRVLNKISDKLSKMSTEELDEMLNKKFKRNKP